MDKNKSDLFLKGLGVIWVKGDKWVKWDFKHVGYLVYFSFWSLFIWFGFYAGERIG